LDREDVTAQSPSPHLPPGLPPDLRAVLDRLAHGVSRKAAAGRAAAQSRTYRAGGGSQRIATADDALAYAFTRLPATYAAVTAVFDAMEETLPGFAPRTMLDVGAGPGTAAFAAVRAFPSLSDVRLVDANARLRDLALTLMAGADSAALRHVAESAAETRSSYRHGDALTVLADAAPADLVTASYAAGEIAAGDLPRFTRLLWAVTAGALVIVMPGTPDGCATMQRMRADLTAAGAHVAAPCPHGRPCPLQPPGWCHFARRLPRSRDHLQVKGADVPFEDEKFSYVVVSRAPPRPAAARVLAPPHVTRSAVTAKLCKAEGVETVTAARRDAETYRRFKSWRWGDGAL
jgi:ribosomal protein RSM22 (predicted rRNA methylase)